MPVTMSFNSPGRGFHSSPRQPLSGIESGNSLSNKPVVRQSKLYREKESGNAMKALFGQDHLSWKTDEQEGVFAGQGVYDAKTHTETEGATGTAPLVFGGEQQVCGEADEIEYPFPGSVASCDACGSVVNRYYHCADCPEETGLFDVCTECCAALYLKQGSPRALSMGMPDHPTHDYKNHRMVHITP